MRTFAQLDPYKRYLPDCHTRLFAGAATLGIILLTVVSSPGQLPSGWTDTDIGSPAMAGSASYSAGNWTITGGGSDIWDSSDQFHFAYNTLVTNYAVGIARVTAVQATDPWAKAGIMFRDSTDASSSFAMVVATSGNGVNFQWRSAFAGQCGNSLVSGINAPVWVKLVRAGADFTAYYSTDGSAWTPIGPSQTVAMRDVAPVGLAVTAHNTAQLNTSTFTGVTVSNTIAPPPPAPVVFGVYRQLWTGLNGSGSLDSLTNTVNNPSWPNSPTAGYTKTFTNFEAEVDLMDSYGQRMRTLVVPPTNGNYSFWISSDDNSELYLSSDESPANKIRIASVPGWTASREWPKYAEQRSPLVSLEGGRRYYLEALMAEGSGGDNLAVRWQLPDGNFEEPIPATSSAGTRLVPFDGVDVTPGIYQQTTNIAVVEGQDARFSVLVTNKSSVSYQWTLGGGNISGATKPFHTVSNVSVTINNGQVYRCVVNNSAGSVTSTAITLTVVPDTVRPTVVRALNVGTTNVQVVYSEPVEAVTATNTGNYVFTNGLSVTRALLSTDNMTVMLTTAPLVYSSNYSIVINRVRDRASSPNVIATNTTVRFTALPYTTQDIGTPPITSSLLVVSNGVNVTASGADVGGYSDQCGFSYSVRSGDFDVAVRLAGLSLPDVWAKAGLMARESMDPGSRFAGSFATPAMNGCFFEWRDPAYANSGSGGGFPVNYPYTWLRLKRAGNTFTGFAGYDGQSWAQLGNMIITMPNQVYFGMVVSSHNNAQTATAQFRDIVDVTNAVVGVVAAPHEPLGPSSRKTPIVISEIMYKPAERADTNNLEFIEIYNSNPWFHDLSGYRLVGDNLSYTFPAGTVIQGGAFLVIAASPQNMEASYGLAGVTGPYVGSIKTPDKLQLLDEQGSVLLTVPYKNESPWPVATDGTGHSLVLANPTYGEADPRAWDISDSAGGSPGQMDPYRPSPLRNVMINEFLAHTDLPDVDYVELYNHANQAVNISGCILTDDAATNKFVVPGGTVIPARGFVSFPESALSFSLNAAGETLYFKNPNQSRYLDAVHFGGQENGVSTGRWPDGASDWYRLNSKTPGTNNGSVRLSNIVINELMYNPISGDDDVQYVELFNRSSTAANLTGWKLDDGISFTFPTNTIMSPGTFLVVARDAARLRTNYANLNAINCLGDFSGKLAHGGERVTLRMPDTIVSTNGAIVSTNLIHITVNEVTYETGGRWGQWAAGGGSSLELLDPNSNNRLAANWGDSDETAKSSWTNIESTGVLDHGANYDPAINYAQLGLLDSGECLVDNVEVIAGTTGPNLAANSTFEPGTLANWSLQGCMSRSGLQAGGYGGSGYCLRVRTASRLFTGANSCQVALAANSLAQGQTGTLRFKARWLRGWPEVLLRLSGNWLEAGGPLAVPSNLGTPGAANSRYVSNLGPAVYGVTHSPPVPAAFEAAVVTARVQDPQGVTNLTLYYRLDPATAYAAAAMRDDGTSGDIIASNGIFSATIPGQAANTIAAFYVMAADGRGATTRFPALLNDDAPVRECLVMFGDGNPGGSFGVYHLWISGTNVQRWIALSDLSNESHDSTMVNGHRVIYNMQARWAGSPYHQGFDTPYGNLCHYKWTFPDDDKFLGATSFNKIHQPGNGAGDDGSIQREQLAHTFLRTLGVPWLNRRYVAVYVNGNRRGTLMEDNQTPDADVVEQNFPDDADGWLYKMQPWFEFGPFPQGISIPFANESWCNIMPYTTTGGVKKKARYRWNFLVRRTPTSASDFSPVFTVVDAASTYGTPNYVANMETVADMENWMRVFAANHAAGNWDAFGCQNAQNLYGYTGTKGTKYTLLMFDFNIVIGNSGSWGPGQNLFAVNGQDSNTQNLYNEPTFRRMYWRALEELVNGPLDVSKSGPLLDAKYATFAANGLNVENPNSNIKNWLTQARTSISGQLAGENATGFTVSSTVTVSNGVGYITGTAPVGVATIWVNGGEYPLTWTSVTGYRIAVPLQPGGNQLRVVGVDIQNQPVTGASNMVSAVYGGSLPSPVGQVVINEIMQNPAVPGAEYIELYNNSTNITFDLSGYDLRGLSYTFAAGSVIGPTNYLLLASDAPAFARAYGANMPVFDTFSGVLQADGETLKLVKPGTNVATDVVVAGIKYDTVAPWPTNGNAPGTSLQLLHPAQENSRLANWGLGRSVAPPPQWVYFSTNGTATASTLYIYLASAGDIYIDDLRLVAGTAPDTGANLVANGDFESTLSGPWTLATNFSTSILSTTVKHSGNSSLHVIATSPGAGAGSSVYQVISPSLTSGQPYSLSFWYLQTTNGNPLIVRLSGSGVTSGSINTTPPAPVLSAVATPGTVNSVRTNLPLFQSLWINEIQAENLTGVTNSAGQRVAWFELYNPSTNVVPLTGIYVANNFANLAEWSFPAGTVINPGQFKLIFADGQTTLSTPAEPHTTFTLPAGAGSLALSRVYNGQLQVLDYLNYTNLAPNHSYGSLADGQNLARMEFYYPTAGGTNNGTSPPLSVAINEWMAGNTNTLLNPVNGKYSDWFEIYNFGTNPANLAGYYLTDTTTNKFKFQIPPGYVIGPKSFLLVWADGRSTNGTPELHTDFKLNKAGSSIGLYGADGSTIDFVTFGPQLDDVSQGRYPDGIGGQFTFSMATPSTNNVGPNPMPVMIQPSDQYIFAGQTLSFTVQAVDPEAPPQVLTFALTPGAPPGVSVTAQGVFSWTPSIAQAPSTNFITVVVTDNGSPVMSDSKTFVVVVYRPNTPPVLSAIPSQSVYANTPLGFTAVAADTDQPSQALTFSLEAGAPPGASITAAGSFSWTPTPAQAPSTNLISVTVTDNGTPAMSDSKTLTVVVYRPNTAPVLAVITNQTVYANTLLTFNASATDTDQPPQSIAFSLGSGAPAGAAITTGGLFTWTPTAGQAPGTNTLSVIARDNGTPQLGATNSFNVVVYRPNTAPVLAVITNQTVYANTPLTFNASATDTDQPPQSITFSLGSGAPAGAAITAGGLFTWTPTAGQAPSTNTLSVIARDNGTPQLSATNFFNVVVYRPNTAPVLAVITNQTVYANTLLTLTASATDTDQPPQSITFSLGSGAPAGAAITTAGLFTWTPTAGQAPSTNTLSVIARDNGTPQLSATNSFNIVVYRPNTAPVLAVITNQTVYANTLLTFNASATDTDQPPQSITFSLGSGAPAGAAITTGGLFTWTPTAGQAPSTNTLSVIARDSGVPQLSVTNSFNVVVYRPNTAPVLALITNQTVYANTLLTFTASATDTDQPPQSITFSLGSGAPTGAAITTAGLFTWTPTAGQAPSTNTLSVIARDNGTPQLSATNFFNVVVYRPNTAPVLAVITNQTIYANTLLTFTASATDTDQPPQSITFSLGSGAPAGAAITTGGLFTWTPTAGQAPSTNTLSVIARDSGVPQLSVTNSFNVVVYRPNTAPVLAVITNQTVYANTLLTLTASATDTDQPPQSITFSLGSGAPTGAAITTAGLFAWTPTAGQAPSTNTLSVIVRDNGTPQLSATNSFNIVVYGPNTAPVLAVITNQTVYANTLLSFTASATDTDQPPQSITFSLGSGAPAGAAITTAGLFAWTPTAGQAPSTNTLSVIVRDNGLPQLSDTQDFTIIVNETNTTAAVALQSAASLAGSFTDESGATIDTTQKTITTSVQASQRFYRLRSDVSTRIVRIRLEGNQVVITYE